MPSDFRYNTSYFWEEGKPNLQECLRISFAAAIQQKVQKLIIFTGSGEGIRLALDYLSQDEYAHIRLVAVTFPHGQSFTSTTHPHFISDSDLKRFSELKVPVVRAHLPFDPIRAQFQGHGILGQDFSLLGNVLSIFGGSMSLCVQAVLMACDAGVVIKGEHVISMTSDTSILVRSAPTADLLTDFVVREIFCKPVLLTIGKQEKIAASSETATIAETSDQKMLEG